MEGDYAMDFFVYFDERYAISSIAVIGARKFRQPYKYKELIELWKISIMKMKIINGKLKKSKGPKFLWSLMGSDSSLLIS